METTPYICPDMELTRFLQNFGTKTHVEASEEQAPGRSQSTMFQSLRSSSSSACTGSPVQGLHASRFCKGSLGSTVYTNQRKRLVHLFTSRQRECANDEQVLSQD